VILLKLYAKHMKITPMFQYTSDGPNRNTRKLSIYWILKFVFLV